MTTASAVPACHSVICVLRLFDARRAVWADDMDPTLAEQAWQQILAARSASTDDLAGKLDLLLELLQADLRPDSSALALLASIRRDISGPDADFGVLPPHSAVLVTY